MAVHALQGIVASALQGQVEMRTDLRKPGKLRRELFCDDTGL